MRDRESEQEPQENSKTGTLNLRFRWGGVAYFEGEDDPSVKELRGPKIAFPSSKDFRESITETGLRYFFSDFHEGVSSGGFWANSVEILLASSAAWTAAASVIKKYLTRHNGNKVIIFDNDGKPLLEVDGDQTTNDIEILLRARLHSIDPSNAAKLDPANDPDSMNEQDD
jgi:hypothetical protein